MQGASGDRHWADALQRSFMEDDRPSAGLKQTSPSLPRPPDHKTSLRPHQNPPNGSREAQGLSVTSDPKHFGLPTSSA